MSRINEVPNGTEILMKVTQVAARLGVSVRTIWRLVNEGKLAQPVSIGRCKRWRSADVDQFMNSL